MENSYADAAVWFGENVKTARKWRGWTLTDLGDAMAEALGRRVGTSTVQRMETGGRPTPVDEVVVVAALLRTTPQALLSPPDAMRREFAIRDHASRVRDELNEVEHAAEAHLNSRLLLMRDAAAYVGALPDDVKAALRLDPEDAVRRARARYQLVAEALASATDEQSDKAGT